ncbi:MASE1 domain-containing protein [Streptomyces actuosus]|uniref:MASE1 domain-containing protein n=1 Tax=Streptomyces actuosus TaxID=1885 RepID=A0ABS2VHK7_STRAS|nr:MASE1 domain-containing protein [Streptomyces actuosus]MBN0042566.1 MASE1 domain-containing protein [Streptomyces actuosus]
MAAVEATQDQRRALALVAQMLAVAGAYYLAGRLGLLEELTVEGAVFSPIWPPTGVAVAALLFLGLRVWPGISLGVLLVIASIAPLSPAVIGTVVGNTAAPVCAYLMLRRVGFRLAMNRLRDGLALVFLGALGAMLISSTMGAGLLVLTDKITPGSFWAVWLGWWVGDAMGVLIVTPALILLGRVRLPLRLSRWPEALALLLAVCCLVPIAAYSTLSLMFLIYPLLIWAALRFQLAGSVLCALAASVLITVVATDGTGAFQDLSHVQVMIKLQAFNGSMALTALLLSALITEQQNTRRSVQRACQELAEVLEHLTATDAASPERTPTQDEGPARPDR